MTIIIAGNRMAQLLEKHRQEISRSPELAILGAHNGGEIVELHRKHLARLLILDVVIPGLPPEEICRSVRADAEMRNVSLIVIGTAASMTTLKRCAANRSFLRPLDQKDFLGAVRSLIEVAARKDFRVLVGVQIKGTMHSTPFFGRSENISSTGILFSANRVMAIGDRPEINLVLPGQGQIHSTVEIQRVESSPGKDARYGARFIDPGQRVCQMIEAFIERKTL
jgi:CheY-like chemotaxis protein